jgi:hypothetical protein
VTEAGADSSDDRPNVLRCVAIGASIGVVPLVIFEVLVEVVPWLLPSGPPGAVAFFVGLLYALVAMFVTLPFSALGVSVAQNLVRMVPLGGAIWGAVFGLVYGFALKLARRSQGAND